ncbi:MAG: flagellar type III secretion system pore protein FliP [Roseburia sp.]|nr:flagellar type III secretion system pore protein FliP [Roseburia sp.]
MRTHKRLFSVVVKGMSLVMVLCILTFFSDTIVNAVPSPNVRSDSQADEIGGSGTAGVSDPEDPDAFQFNITSNAGSSSLSASLQMLLVLTVLSLAPSILIMMTSFTRIIVVLHFVRSALGTQTTPPNQVMVGLALFLTLFIMSPVISDINQNCVQPFQQGELTQEEALNAGLKPIREFMFEQTNRSDIRLFLDIEGQDRDIETEEDIPTMVLMPAFVISELRTSFTIGFLIYLPFIVIDMVVASTLMSMGMMMLPPTTISMPFKILLFVLADGWNLVIGQVVKTFY